MQNCKNINKNQQSTFHLVKANIFHIINQNTQMQIKIILSIFFLLVVSVPLCVDPLQRQGECTKCNALDVLMDGRCFVKLKGCYRHDRIKNTPDKYKCAQCQFGYGFNKDGICERLSVLAKKDVEINPNTFDNKTTLSQSDIKDKLGELYGSFFTYAHDQFLINYASQLGKGKIKSVNKVQSKKGVVLTIDYISDTNIPYQAVALVEKSGFVREWSFGMPLVGVKQPYEIYNWIVKVLGDKIKSYYLFDYRFEEGRYVLEFMANSTDDVIRASINKADIQNQIDVTQKLIVKNINLAYLAIENFGKSFPNYKPEDITGVRKFDGFYVVNFGPSLTVSFNFYNDKFITNMPIFRPSYQATTNQNNAKPILGGYSNFTNYQDPGFLSCIQFAIKLFPQLLNVSIVKVESQIVQGTNYNISLKKQVQNSQKIIYYQLETYLSLDSNIQLNSLKKNGVILYHFQYNYNEDPYFFKGYKELSKQKIEITNQGITSVLYKTQDNKKYYKVVYTPKQYAEFEISADTNVTKLLSVTIQGENVLETLAPYRELAKSRSSEVLMKFIKEKQPTFTYSRVQQIIQNQNLYSMKITNSQGTYIAILEDKGGLIKLMNVTKISPASCYTLSSQEAQSSQKISVIDDFLRASFPLQGYNPQFIQLNIKVASTNYRILYANSKLKQIQIHLEQVDGAAIVTKASYMNYGFEMVDPIPTNEDYQNILSIIKNSSMTGTRIPFLTETNETFVNSYYDDGKSTTQISVERGTNKSNIQVIATRSYLLAPDGFNLANLLIPGSPPQADTANLQKILQQASKKYSIIMGVSTIAFAEKSTNNVYNVMFKNDVGYQKIEAKFDQKGVLTLGRLNLTGYHQSDFSNCKKYGPNGKCLSCNQQTQVEYEGACFTKLNGCLIQPGNICVRCNANFIKSGQKCYEHCTYFFQ